MRVWRFFSVLVVLPLFFLACSEKSDAPSDPGVDDGVLMGRVVDASGENALGGATVRIEGTDLVAVTAEDGSFEFTGLAEGDFTVVIEPPAGAECQANRVGVSVHDGETVTVDLTVLPDTASVDAIAIYPATARVGILESVQFFIGGPGMGGVYEDDGQVSFPFRATWTIQSDHTIGVISREGIFIGTAIGSGHVVASLSESLSAVAEIEVVADGDIARIVVHPSYRIEVASGETQYFAAYAVNGAGDIAADADLVWGVEPSTLGTIEPVTGLTDEEVMAIYQTLLWGGGWDFGTGPAGEGSKDDGDGVAVDSSEPGDSGGTTPPEPPPWDIDPSAIRLALFTATESGGAETSGHVSVKGNGADWSETVEVSVVERGELTSVYLYPEDVMVTPGSEITFAAYGLNEAGRLLPGLEYTWSVIPASLGDIEVVEFPWMDPSMPGGSDEDGGSDWGGIRDTVWPPDGPYPPMPPIPPDGPISDWQGAAVFRPAETGDGEVRVVVHDPIADVTIEMTATVHVAEAPALASVEVKPNPIEAIIGDSTFVEAIAMNTWNDIDWGSELRFEFEGNAGTFVPVDRPHVAEQDSVGPHEPPDDPNHPTDPPDGGSSHGIAYGVFFANNPGGTGVLRVMAVSSDGVTVVTEVPVTAIER
jgi:hypothetical protein